MSYARGGSTPLCGTMKMRYILIFIVILFPGFVYAQEKYQSDFLYNLDLYRQNHEQYRINKLSYADFQSINSKSKAIASQKQVIISRNLVLKTYFQHLHEQLQLSKNDTQDYSQIGLMVDSVITDLDGMNESIQVIDDLDSLNSFSDLIEENRVYYNNLSRLIKNVIYFNKLNKLHLKYGTDIVQTLQKEYGQVEISSYYDRDLQNSLSSINSQGEVIVQTIKDFPEEELMDERSKKQSSLIAEINSYHNQLQNHLRIIQEIITNDFKLNR